MKIEREKNIKQIARDMKSPKDYLDSIVVHKEIFVSDLKDAFKMAKHNLDYSQLPDLKNTDIYWRPFSIKGQKMQSFAEWLNKWGDFRDKNEQKKQSKNYKKGYNDAIYDVFRYLGLGTIKKDRRTKSGWREQK